MHKLRYQIITKSPIVISAKYGDMNMVTTEKFIPGNTVIGILAGAFMRGKNISKEAHEDEDFFSGFLAGNLKISHAYIYLKDKDNKERVYFPVPFSIQKKKDDNTVIDLMHVDENFDQQTQSMNTFCFLKGKTLHTKNVETALNFHHARDREKGAPKKGIIFNYESICPGQIFRGDITGKETELQKIIDICGNRWTAYAGRSRNAQYGKVLFEIIDEKPQPGQDSISWGNEISLTFLSETIIYNENGLSTTDTDDLGKYLGGAQIKKAFVKAGQIENFVGVWQLKKPSETCFLAGSTFLLDISKSDPAKLAEFQQNGIGERTHEGFGRCKFGWQTEEELTETAATSPELQMPETDIPEKAKEILQMIVRESIIKQVELNALEGQAEFIRPPTNSLISRLEAMLKSAKEQSIFLAVLNRLRETARDQLERCNNGTNNLLEFLIITNPTVKDILNQTRNDSLKEMCEKMRKVIGYEPENDPILTSQLYQRYLGTFFSIMRKNVKNKERG